MTFLPRTRPKPSKICPPLNFLVTAANLRLFCENYSFRCYLLYIFRRKADHAHKVLNFVSILGGGEISIALSQIAYSSEGYWLLTAL